MLHGPWELRLQQRQVEEKKNRGKGRMREQICNSTLVLRALTIIDKCNVRARPGTG
jgi:hypothetical protein